MTRPAAVGLAVFAASLAALLLIHARATPHPPFPRARAVAAAQRASAGYLSSHPWTDARAIALDRSDWRVTFFDGQRLVLDVAIGPHGEVDAVEVHDPKLRPPGSKIAWRLRTLLLLTFLFVGATAVRPLRRLRNLDVFVVALGFGAALVLLDGRFAGPQSYAGAAALVYLAARCGMVGFGREPGPRIRERSLYANTRIASIVAAALLVACLLMTLTSTGISDVAFAGLAGATHVNHGVLPYGHITHEIVHGDTYPLGTYLLYAPFAALVPVADSFATMDGALDLNAIALVAAAALVFALARRVAPLTSRSAAINWVIAWLAFPPLVLAASGGGNDVPTAVFVLIALLLLARPAAASAAVIAAAWVKVVPAAALVVWLPALRGRGLVRAALAVALAIAVGLGALVALGGLHGISAMTHALGFQFERGSWLSVWMHIGGRTPQTIFQAAVVAVVVLTALEVRRQGASTLGLRRLAALAGMVVLLLQVAANYWTYAYLPWVMPLVLVALLPPVEAGAPSPR